MPLPRHDRRHPRAPVRRGLWLAALTIAWNVIEAVVAIGAGLAAGSLALVAFGFDSIIEVLSACVVVWQLRAELRHHYDEDRERRALRLIAITFFVLAAYVTVEAARDLFFASGDADQSAVGIALAAASLVVMPALAWPSAASPPTSVRRPCAPTPRRRGCAFGSPRHSWAAWCSTPRSAGGGPIRSPPLSDREHDRAHTRGSPLTGWARHHAPRKAAAAR